MISISSLCVSNLTISCSFISVLALHCYACSSLQDESCWNVTLLAPRHVADCEDLYYSCSTRVTTMEGFTFIGRNCLPKGICENTINIEGKIEDRCATCQTDFCNTGSGAGVGGGGARVAGGSKWMSALSIMANWLLVLVFTVIHVNGL